MWRLIDTGLRPPAENIALSRAVLEARAADEIPSTLRFTRFTPSALLGVQGSPTQELHVEPCIESGRTLQRRISDGPALLLDPRQLAWELYVHERDVGSRDPRALVRRMAHAAATAVSALGIDARYRAPRDIELDGRTLGCCTSAVEHGATLVQGFVLVDVDAADYARAIRVPAEGPDAALAWARSRLVDLKSTLRKSPALAVLKHNLVEAFESEFDVEFRDCDLTLTEEQRYRGALDEIQHEGWVKLVNRPLTDAPIVTGEHRDARGVLRATALYDRPSARVRRVAFSGDLDLKPERALFDLEAALADMPLERIEQRIDWFFGSRPVRSTTLDKSDFVRVITLAVQRHLIV